MADKKASIGCLFWIALILLVLVVILFNLKQINNVIKSTGMDRVVNNLFKKAPPVFPPAGSNDAEPEEDSLPQQDREQTDEPTIALQPEKEEEADEFTIDIPEQPQAAEDDRQDLNIRNASLYFARLSDEGEISFVPVKRKVSYSDSPLTSTLQSLIKGPNYQEINSGLLNLLPAETRLKNIYVRGNTAYLDFNENFRFNNLGKEGMRVQLQQVVYTATEFMNVYNIQILIEGQVVDYMGPEGIYIGKPLDRESF